MEEKQCYEERNTYIHFKGNLKKCYLHQVDSGNAEHFEASTTYFNVA